MQRLANDRIILHKVVLKGTVAQTACLNQCFIKSEKNGYAFIKHFEFFIYPFIIFKYLPSIIFSFHLKESQLIFL